MHNWNQVTRQKLYKEFKNELYSLGTVEVPIKLIQKTIKQFFEQRFFVIVKNKLNKKIELNSIYVGGCYISENDEDGLPAIQLDFYYNREQTNIVTKKSSFRRLAKLAVDTLFHEIIHMRQHRSRNFKEIPSYFGNASSLDQQKTQSYLGDKDEIGAFAFNLACELWDKFGDDHLTSANWLDTDSWQTNPKSIFYDYMICFDGDHNNGVIKKLKIQTVKFLANYDIDRPYRTARYLTY